MYILLKSRYVPWIWKPFDHVKFWKVSRIWFDESSVIYNYDKISTLIYLPSFLCRFWITNFLYMILFWNFQDITCEIFHFNSIFLKLHFQSVRPRSESCLLLTNVELLFQIFFVSLKLLKFGFISAVCTDNWTLFEICYDFTMLYKLGEMLTYISILLNNKNRENSKVNYS